MINKKFKDKRKEIIQNEKLLSLLSVLTISGTAVPTAIAASPYQKKENDKILDSNRNKRSIPSLDIPSY